MREAGSPQTNHFVRKYLRDVQKKDLPQSSIKGLLVSNFVTKMLSDFGFKLPTSSFMSSSLLHPILQNKNHTKTEIMTEYNLCLETTHKIELQFLCKYVNAVKKSGRIYNLMSSVISLESTGVWGELKEILALAIMLCFQKEILYIT